MTRDRSLPVVNAPGTFTGSETLDAAWQFSQDLLSTFTRDPDVGAKMQLAFDGDVQPLISLARAWASGDLTSFPDIEIRPAVDLNGALGAFAGEIDRIYLSQELLTDHADNIQVVAEVLLEELGHALDSQQSRTDTEGDEGAVFAQQVRGVDLDSGTLQALKQEDDTVVLTIEGQVLQLEQATAGVNPAFDLIGLTDLRNDPLFADIDGSGVRVAVIDTGLDRTHSLLEGNYITGVDFVNGGNNPVDRIDHGTHVAGIVGASEENIGVAPDVGLIGLQVFEPNGSAYNSTIENALEWVLDNRDEYNIVAVNMSLGSGFFSSESRVFDILKDDVQRLEDAGITVVSAAGNSYENNEYKNLAAPAIYSTLAVGAVWQDGTTRGVRWQNGARDRSTGTDRIVSFSQRLDAPNVIFAPGAFINSTVPGDRTEESAGTSMASPMVAGTVALMQEAALEFGGRLLSPSEVQEIIVSTADSIFDGDDEEDNVDNTNISYPRLNVYEAVKEIQRRFTGNAPPPVTGGSGDSNGTIAGAFLGPVLDGSPVAPLLGAIGVDGNSTEVGDRDVDIFRFEVSSGGNVTI
ncbi:MAG: S8 family serine peptidase [Hormoscilla sp. GUM202]|nr:S8 family serine peptidase [Hormoscilla sp. GUM202]